jgi:ketosteroid isomerase-like protein
MRARISFAMLLLLVAFTSATARAQSVSAEQAVRAQDDRERVAALNRDVSALEVLWSEQFTVNAPNNQVVVGRQENLDTFVRGGIINFSSFERAIEFVRVDGDFAVIMGLETVVPRTDAPSAGLVAGQVIRRRFTNIWKKEGDTWRLYWRHANVIASR